MGNQNSKVRENNWRGVSLCRIRSPVHFCFSIYLPQAQISNSIGIDLKKTYSVKSNFSIYLGCDIKITSLLGITVYSMQALRCNDVIIAVYCVFECSLLTQCTP